MRIPQRIMVTKTVLYDQRHLLTLDEMITLIEVAKSHTEYSNVRIILGYTGFEVIGERLENDKEYNKRINKMRKEREKRKLEAQERLSHAQDEINKLESEQQKLEKKLIKIKTRVNKVPKVPEPPKEKINRLENVEV